MAAMQEGLRGDRCTGWTPPVYGMEGARPLDEAENPEDDEEMERLRKELRRLEELLSLDLLFKIGVLFYQGAFDWPIQEWCEDAAVDFGRGLNAIKTLPDVYVALRARACFEAQKFSDAVACYEQLFRTRNEPGDRLHIYNAITRCLDMSDDAPNLKIWFGRLLEEFPNEEEVHTRLAELEARTCNYSAALKHLRMEVELYPGQDDDWKISAILAISESSEDWEEVKANLKQMSAIWNPIVDLLRFHWPSFANMCEQAQEEWIAAFWIRGQASREDSRRLTLYRKAALSCATAAEIEIRNRIFIPFQKYVNGSTQLKAGIVSLVDPALQRFLMGGRPEALGEMANTLNSSVYGRHPLHSALCKFTSDFIPRFQAHIPTLRRIANFRNAATHSSTDAFDPDVMMEMCRTVISSIACTKAAG